MKENVATWLRLKASDPKMSNKDIAATIGIAPKTLDNTLAKARKEGWLTFTDPLNELRYGMIPKIADNLNLFLDARDKQVTIEAAKATLFRQYQVEEGIQDSPTTILALKIELPDGYTAADLPKPKGVIIERPNTFTEGDAVEVDK